MKILYWVLLLSAFACQERKRNSEDSPDAVRDLLIDRSFWQKKAVGQSQKESMSIHRFSITNTSQRYVYQHIKIRFDYYDRDFHKIDSSIRIVDRVIEPRSAIRVDTLETKLAKEGIASATATVVNASAD